MHIYIWFGWWIASGLLAPVQTTVGICVGFGLLDSFCSRRSEPAKTKPDSTVFGTFTSLTFLVGRTFVLVWIRKAMPRIFAPCAVCHLYTLGCAPYENMCWAYKSNLSVIQQCFFFTTNQRTMLSMVYQSNKQTASILLFASFGWWLTALAVAAR